MLKVIKQNMLSALKLAGIFTLVKNSRWKQQRLLTLSYHGLSPYDEHLWNPEMSLTVQTLRDRFQILKDGDYNVVPLYEALVGLRSGNLPSKAVVLTFEPEPDRRIYGF